MYKNLKKNGRNPARERKKQEGEESNLCHRIEHHGFWKQRIPAAFKKDQTTDGRGEKQL